MVKIKSYAGDYIEKRRESVVIYKIEMTGYAIVKKYNAIIEARIFKPSQYEVEEFIDFCNRYKQTLIGIINDRSNNNIELFSQEELDEINSLKISKLIDCKIISRYCLLLSMRLRLNVKALHEPILSGTLTFYEALFISILGLIIFGIYGLLK